MRACHHSTLAVELVHNEVIRPAERLLLRTPQSYSSTRSQTFAASPNSDEQSRQFIGIMSSNKSYDESSRPKDNIKRGIKNTNIPGTATFFGLRAADPFLQYGILSQGWANPLIQTVGGSVLPKGPPVITNTPFDALGLSPYRSIIFGMSVGSMVKQNFHLVTIMQEEMPPSGGAFVGIFNAVFNSLNSIFFICSQTSASVNGEHFPQTPLIVGSTLYATGLFIEWYSEVQRAVFKKKPENKGKVYDGGLFGLSRHVNYLGYTMWRSGYALAAGGWTWGAVVASIFTYVL